MPVISKRYSDFVHELKQVIEAIEAEEGNFGISVQILREVRNLRVTYNRNFGIYADTYNRGAEDVKKMAESFKILRKKITQIQQSIKNNQNYKLTNKQKIQLHIHINVERRDYVPMPNIIPAINVIDFKPNYIIIQITIEGQPIKPRSYKKPKDVKTILVKWEVVERGEAEPTVFTNSTIKTKTRFKLEFKDEDAGKYVYIKAFYYNGRSEPSKASRVFKALVN